MSSKTAPAPPSAPHYTGQGHPSDETLIAHHREELSHDEREKICGHLAACGECSQKVLDLEIFFSSASPKGRLDPDDLVEAWNQLIQTLEHEGR